MFLGGSLRFAHVGSAYDVWQDEVNYVDLSISFRHGQFPPRFDGDPFLLHPPLFFALSALWEDLVRTSGSYFDVVDSVRALNIVFAIASAGLLYALGTRLGNRYTGAAAGLVFACDPYIMRQNGRALLETSTLMWVLAGYLILLRGLPAPRWSSEVHCRGRRVGPRAEPRVQGPGNRAAHHAARSSGLAQMGGEPFS